ncbi:serpin family protein [Cellulosilyticum ruminicola]|uniref:serpin family protein n=1 Tax=Cellulosilyticum ruminicola TaxID=425254 RepID=UPI0006CF31F1|nr:serpin family protein [Cellulosilyticum ruminicola]
MDRSTKFNKMKYKRRRADRRLRILSRIVLATCVSVTFVLWVNLGIKVSTACMGVTSLNADKQKIKVNIPDLTEAKVYCLFDKSFNLFKASCVEGENNLIAPYMTLMTLGILENGAVGDTATEIETYLNNFTMSEMNETFGKLQEKIRNYQGFTFDAKGSIWLNPTEDEMPKDYFLKVNETYYGADLFRANLHKSYTREIMQEWVENNMGHKLLIPLEEINEAANMYVLSTMNMKSNWEIPYTANDLLDGKFKLIDGKSKPMQYMHSKEDYLETDTAVGFIKPYKGKKCSFVAIKPTNHQNIYEYLQGIDSTELKKIIHSKNTQKATVAIPKFTYEGTKSLKESLQYVGIKTVFDALNADFNKIYVTNNETYYISDMIQNNAIEINEGNMEKHLKKETKTEEATTKNITFNEPFLYAIIDNETRLPLTMGIVADPTEY